MCRTVSQTRDIVGSGKVSWLTTITGVCKQGIIDSITTGASASDQPGGILPSGMAVEESPLSNLPNNNLTIKVNTIIVKT